MCTRKHAEARGKHAETRGSTRKHAEARGSTRKHADKYKMFWTIKCLYAYTTSLCIGAKYKTLLHVFRGVGGWGWGGGVCVCVEVSPRTACCCQKCLVIRVCVSIFVTIRDWPVRYQVLVTIIVTSRPWPDLQCRAITNTFVTSRDQSLLVKILNLYVEIK